MHQLLLNRLFQIVLSVFASSSDVSNHFHIEAPSSKRKCYINSHIIKGLPYMDNQIKMLLLQFISLIILNNLDGDKIRTTIIGMWLINHKKYLGSMHSRCVVAHGFITGY